MYMKKLFFRICYYVNVLMLFVTFVIITVGFFNLEWISTIINGDTFIYLRFLLSIPMVILWVWCLLIWSKHDKKISRFLLLFFLMGFYPIFYYHKVIKNNWL